MQPTNQIPYTIRKQSYKIWRYYKSESGTHHIVEFAPGWQYNGLHIAMTTRLSTMEALLKKDLRKCTCYACQRDLENIYR